MNALVKTQGEKSLEALTISFLHWPTSERIVFFNPSKTNVPYHIETSQLIFNSNQFTGFYMMGNIGSYWVKVKFTQIKQLNL